MKKYLKIIVSIIAVLTMVSFMTVSKADVSKEKSIEDFIINNTTIDIENPKESDIITIIEELTNNYSTEELADILEQYGEELEESGLDEETLGVVSDFLRSTDTNTLRSVINNIDLEDVKDRLNKGEDIDTVIEDTIENMPTEQIVGTAAKMLFTNKYVKRFIIESIIRFSLYIALLTAYMIVIRWLIYTKAGEKGWASLIPIYRDVVWLKIAGMSPWLLLLWLIPIFGWMAVGIVNIIACFKIPEKFGKSTAWGIGLWLVPIVFESIVAFSKDFEFKKEENETTETVNE